MEGNHELREAGILLTFTAPRHVLGWLLLVSFGYSGACGKSPADEPTPLDFASLGQPRHRASLRRACKDRRKTIAEHLAYASSCERSADCRVVALSTCAIKSIRRGYVSLNPARAEGFLEAVFAYEIRSCGIRDCKRRLRPDRASCWKGRCTLFPRAVSMRLGKTASLEGTFISPTFNVQWILRLAAAGTFTWGNWSHFGGREDDNRVRGTWRSTGPSRIALTLTDPTQGLKPPSALTVVAVGAKRVLMDDTYIRTHRSYPTKSGGEHFVEQKRGETGVPHLLLFNSNIRDLAALLRTLNTPK